MAQYVLQGEGGSTPYLGAMYADDEVVKGWGCYHAVVHGDDHSDEPQVEPAFQKFIDGGGDLIGYRSNGSMSSDKPVDEYSNDAPDGTLARLEKLTYIDPLSIAP